ncbi:MULTISPECIES: hypothetical protein [unclassified Microbacterium]|jgi:hypothetical protein|nr:MULTISPECIES: hypothetical protein [unclassified Microbacterium]EIC08189.1 hypothetical protein OR221_1720 [Microbacterium laevaniformans OR221]EPD83085.1 hypothetical protein HMPREF1529_02453 [Microbacterium sp. oral taxon 186 str. F0373]RKS86200.1 hypothetical protein DEU37_2564 [Microbacterium sp. AG790]
MHTFIASALHASDPERRRIRLAEREREQRELEWQRRRQILPYL